MSRKITRRYSKEVRAQWGSGPWQDEPDEVLWVDEATKYPCKIGRGDLGNLCGYVSIPLIHPLAGVELFRARRIFDVHGGITYSAAHGKRRWRLGFDCMQVEDTIPVGPDLQELFHNLNKDAVYRDVAFVEENVQKLVTQLYAIEQGRSQIVDYKCSNCHTDETELVSENSLMPQPLLCRICRLFHAFQYGSRS